MAEKEEAIEEVFNNMTCNMFMEDRLCISQLGNLLGRYETDHELICQERCQTTQDCKHWTLMQSANPRPDEAEHLCYLWKVCRADVDCIESGADCISSVKGPAYPHMADACCSLFRPAKCTSLPLISLPAVEEAVCQVVMHS